MREVQLAERSEAPYAFPMAGQRQRPQTVKAVVAGGVGAVGADLVSPTPVLAATGVVGAGLAEGVVGGLADWLGEQAQGRLKSRLQKYVEAYCTARGCNPVEAEQEIRSAAESPETSEVLFECMRAIGDALSADVLVALARMTHDYSSAKRPLDRFFRGTRRLLTDLGDEEVRALTSMLGLLIPIVESANQLSLRSASVKTGFLLYARQVDEKGEGAAELLLGPVHHVREIFHLPKVNNLATDPLTPRFGAANGPAVAVLSAEHVRRLHSMLV